MPDSNYITKKRQCICLGECQAIVPLAMFGDQVKFDQSMMAKLALNTNWSEQTFNVMRLAIYLPDLVQLALRFLLP